MDNNIIYKIFCMDDASYVEQMERKLKTRLNDHVKNIRLDPWKHSVISDHINEHSINWKNVKILNFEPKYHKRLISEIIHIKEQKNGLNRNTKLLNESYFNIFDRLAKDT